MRMLYLTTGRYPTNRAYGIQIKLTAAALSDLGAEVAIKAPRPWLQNLLYLGPIGYWLRTIMFVMGVGLSGVLGAFDVVYTRDPLAAYILSYLKKNVFLELHDIGSLKLIKKAALRKNVRGIISISRGLVNALVKGSVDPSKFLIAHDAVDVQKFSITIDQSVVRQDFGLPLIKKIILYAGLFDEWKGYKTLLESSKFLPADTVLVLAGGSIDQVGELKQQYPAVQFLGMTEYDRLPVLQKVADVIVLPNSAKFDISRLYTSPLKLFAAMASGVPIVASDLPSMREIVDETMVTFTTPDDSRALAKAITFVLGDSGKVKVKAQRAFEVVHQFTWQKRARAILTFIETCTRL